MEIASYVSNTVIFRTTGTIISDLSYSFTAAVWNICVKPIKSKLNLKQINKSVKVDEVDLVTLQEIIFLSKYYSIFDILDEEYDKVNGIRKSSEEILSTFKVQSDNVNKVIRNNEMRKV